ncbi:hypothetical protein RRF57_007655 [Xylaria bambusicola]|uniref:Uncharacterized protein n=1 Tax=Xylaria bambusicola TaxID=326684 RepID=A0AAN7Z7P1_9PEZI
MHVPIKENRRLRILATPPPEMNSLNGPSFKRSPRNDELRVIGKSSVQVSPVFYMVSIRVVRIKPLEAWQGSLFLRFRNRHNSLSCEIRAKVMA